MNERVLSLHVRTYEDDDGSITALRAPDDGFSYFDPVLVEKVAQAIREYPNWDAPQWLSPIAVLGVIERHLIASGDLSS